MIDRRRIPVLPEFQGNSGMKDFSISKTENVKESIVRILLGQVDSILEQCKNSRDDIHKSIHEIRKSIKRIRAVLRLIREEIGYSTYYRENVFYRDLSRGLSDIRTQNVLHETLKNLHSELVPGIPEESIEPVLEQILECRDRMLDTRLILDRDFRELAGALKAARKRIPLLPIARNDFRVFEGGMQRMYRKSREYLKAARKETSMQTLHDMRKRMKYLWYQAEIMKPLYPELLKAFADALESITEKLGICHDLDVLSEQLKDPGLDLDEKIRETLLEAIKFKQGALLPVILKEAETALGEKPEAFMARMSEYWRIYQNQTV